MEIIVRVKFIALKLAYMPLLATTNTHYGRVRILLAKSKWTLYGCLNKCVVKHVRFITQNIGLFFLFLPVGNINISMPHKSCSSFSLNCNKSLN